MHIRDAILKAADHIERNPGLYDYGNVRVPGCGTPGCMLGWVAHFMGTRAGEFASRAIGSQFMRRQWVGWFEFEKEIMAEGFDKAVFGNGGAAASYLRAYADKYHPAPRYDWNGLADRLARETEKPRELESIP